jgi:hypothetical protein
MSDPIICVITGLIKAIYIPCFGVLNIGKNNGGLS